MKLCTKFESSNPRRHYCDFSVWPWTLRYVLRSALGPDNFYQVWPSTTYPCLNYKVFMMIRCHVLILTFDLLTLNFGFSHGIKIWTDFFPVLSQCTRLTDGQTDGRIDRQTEFSSLYRDCILCSAVKKDQNRKRKEQNRRRVFAAVSLSSCCCFSVMHSSELK